MPVFSHSLVLCSNGGSFWDSRCTRTRMSYAKGLFYAFSRLSGDEKKKTERFK